MSKKTFSKLLSEKFQISRKKAEDLIKNKKVLLNDNIESRPYLVVQEKDIVSLNEPIEKKVNIILFHKPKGCITSRSDEKNRTIVYDYLPKKFKNYHYIGRLDYNSEGLLLLTDSTNSKLFCDDFLVASSLVVLIMFFKNKYVPLSRFIFLSLN